MAESIDTPEEKRRSKHDEERPLLAGESRPMEVSPGWETAAARDDDVLSETTTTKKEESSGNCCPALQTFVRSIPACVLVTTLNLMMCVPFGSALFPQGVIPLDETERESLGVRLSLLALAVGQGVMGGGASGLGILISWQLGELSPFYHTLAEIAGNCGDEEAILPTTLYLLSMSSITVGAVFYLLGKFGLGQLTHFFPTHVLLGLVGGVGVWLLTLSISVSISPSSVSEGILSSIWTPHFAVTACTAALLRLLQIFLPKEKYMLLDPAFFLSIPLAFYAVLRLFQIDVADAVAGGWMFADPDTDGAGSGAPSDQESAWAEALSLWTLFDVSKVYWNAVFRAASTLLSSGLMGVMVSAPFMPALALLNGQEDTIDFNREFMAHGYSNLLSGLVAPGGLGVAACYSSSVVFKNCGGNGRAASALVTVLTLVAFVYGPNLVQGIPRCMAGALILDMGINLFLEAVLDPEKKCDKVEYTSIWVIIIVMNMFSMTAGLIAGLFTALITYTLQSDNAPVRLICDATSLPSSKWRHDAASIILEDASRGRSQIIVVQLQGNLFFGNIALIEKEAYDFLQKLRGKARIVIFDFSLVLGVDVTAAACFEKMDQAIKKKFLADTFLVSGPLRIANADVGRDQHRRASSYVHNQTPPSVAFGDRGSFERRLEPSRRASLTVRGLIERELDRDATMAGTHFETLDEAVIAAEDSLIKAAQLGVQGGAFPLLTSLPEFEFFEGEEESDEAVAILKAKLCNADEGLIVYIANKCRREDHARGDLIWETGSYGTSAKVLLDGSVTARVDGKEKAVIYERGDILGLRSMILEEKHFATLVCERDCTVYALDKSAYDEIVEIKPEAARLLDLFLARELSRRLRHTSNPTNLTRFVMH